MNVRLKVPNIWRYCGEPIVSRCLAPEMYSYDEMQMVDHNSIRQVMGRAIVLINSSCVSGENLQ